MLQRWLDSLAAVADAITTYVFVTRRAQLMRQQWEVKYCGLSDSANVLQVNFAYKEAGECKQALVKVRVCPKHAMQLNHKQNQQLIKKRKQELQKEQIEHSKRQKRPQNASGSNSKLDHSRNSDGSPESHGEWETGGQDTHGKTSEVDEVFEGLFD